MLRRREGQGEEIKRVKENRNAAEGQRKGMGGQRAALPLPPVTVARDVHFLFPRRPSSHHPTLGADCIRVQRESRLSLGAGALAWVPHPQGVCSELFLKSLSATPGSTCSHQDRAGGRG